MRRPECRDRDNPIGKAFVVGLVSSSNPRLVNLLSYNTTSVITLWELMKLMEVIDRTVVKSAIHHGQMTGAQMAQQTTQENNRVIKSYQKPGEMLHRMWRR